MDLGRAKWCLRERVKDFGCVYRTCTDQHGLLDLKGPLILPGLGS